MSETPSKNLSQEELNAEMWDAVTQGLDTNLEEFLKAGADPNEPDTIGRHGFTPLMCAALNNDLECVQLLLKYGANPLAKTNTGETVFSLHPHQRILEVLSTEAPKHIHEPLTDSLFIIAQLYEADKLETGSFLRNAGIVVEPEKLAHWAQQQREINALKLLEHTPRED